LKNNRIFTGNVMECTKSEPAKPEVVGHVTLGNSNSESKILEENVILIMTRNGFFVTREELCKLTIAYLYVENRKEPFPCGFFMPLKSRGSYRGERFVDEDSIKPYFPVEQQEKRSSILQLQKKMHL
jgi:hypothetical protein